MAEKGWPPVVVGSVFQTGLNLMRDLLSHGVRAVGIDCYPEHEGFRSVYGKSYLCPDPDTEPGRWLDFMRSLSRELGARPVFIPAADIFVSALGAHADGLQEHFLFSRASVSRQAELATKQQQYALAERYGFPCPRTAPVHSAADLEAFCREARFPCLLKPRSQREWESLPPGNTLRGRKLVTAETGPELEKHYHSVAPYQPEAVAQEIIAGPDDAKYCYLSVYGCDGARLGHCVVREFRAHPPQFGSGSIVQPVIDDEIAGLCDGFLRAIGYAGLCEIEVKRDVRDGRVRLIEINPRATVTGDCARYAGVKLGWLHYLDLIGQPVTPAEPHRLDFRHIVLRRDARAFPKYLDAGLITWREWLRSYRRPVEFFDFDARDWKVTAGTLFPAIRAFGGGLLRHFKLRN